MSLPDLTDAERASAEYLVDLAMTEDLGTRGDVTTEALVAESEWAVVDLVARETGTIAGGVLLPIVFAKLDGRVRIQIDVPEGGRVVRGVRVARIEGPLRALLTGERTALNFLLRLSGIATQTRLFVDRVAGTCAGIFDTRKTLPGWRLLDKYAVRAGGGKNHRIGLYDQILIKDNHLAGWHASGAGHSIPEAIRRARTAAPGMIVEVEVDTLEQLRAALSAHPDIILLDNMNTETLSQSVALRNTLAPEVELEASGGVSLATVSAIARTGVERISVGAVTHSATALDLAFDWGIDGHRPNDP